MRPIVTRIDIAAKAAGHPIAGISPKPGGGFTATCIAGSTAEQITTAQAFVDAFDVAASDAAEAANDQRLAADESERSDCKLDAAIMNLVNQTKAEWIAWAGANFPSLTAAEKNKLGQLFWVVAIGVRQRVRNG